MKRICFLLAMVLAFAIALGAGVQQHGLIDGFLIKNGRPVFPIGIYEMPKTNAELETMAKAGINLVRCRSKEDLDRAKAAGMMGWVPLPLQSADQAKIRQMVEADKDNPALAVWEGPDEFVWNFTAASRLYREGVYAFRNEWWRQTPVAIKHSEAEARVLIPRLINNIRLVRNLDDGRHPIWMNEGQKSDMKFVREYVEHVDITGCDSYPIGREKRDPSAIGDYTSRYLTIGEGRPVWMVLQGWAARHLSPGHTYYRPVYPSFVETRLMAYAAVTNGAKGILYWGTFSILPNTQGNEFRDSIYAMTSELAKLQPFLTAPEVKSVRVALTESTGRQQGGRGVRWLARRDGSDWLVVLVNEDNRAHMGVEVKGLEALNGRRLEQLYGIESATVREGEFITRLMPHEVKVFATSRKWRSAWRKGRDFSN